MDILSVWLYYYKTIRMDILSVWYRHIVRMVWTYCPQQYICNIYLIYNYSSVFSKSLTGLRKLVWFLFHFPIISKTIINQSFKYKFN